MWVNNWSEIFKLEPRSEYTLDGEPMVTYSLWWELDIASFYDESGEKQKCYLKPNNDIFKIDGNIVNQIGDIKRTNDVIEVGDIMTVKDGVRCSAVTTQEWGIKYYDRELRRIKKDSPHPSIACNWQNEYFIDAERGKKVNSVWWEVRDIQHNLWVWSNSCLMFKVDEDNNILRIDGHTVIRVWETKQIEWKDYTQLYFNNTRDFFDKDWNRLAIRQWIEEFDQGIIETKHINWESIVIKSMAVTKSEKDRLKSVTISNWENSYYLSPKHRFSDSGIPKFLEPLEYEWQTYILIQYNRRWEDNPDILVLNEKLEEVLEYPIWNVNINRVETIVKEKLSELIPEVA